jgi:hypothetical protein
MTVITRLVNHGIRMLAAVALLLAVMSSSIRPNRAPRITSTPDYLSRNFATPKIPKVGHRGHSAVSASLSSRRADSVQPEIVSEMDADIEDELTVTFLPTCASFEVFPSPCPEAYAEVVRFGVAFAARPLRC